MHLIIICTIFVVTAFVFYMTGCQDVGFTGIPTFNCDEEVGIEGVTCHTPDGGLGDVDPENNVDNNGNAVAGSPTSHTYRNRQKVVNIGTRLGRVDVLFVVDYSKSMKAELRSIGDQFTSFLSDIRETDYQIAIITTDWQSDRGNFLSFSNGQNFLANPNKAAKVHRANVKLFQETITRSFDSSAGDERGIYALNMALDNAGQSSFFRPHSLLLVIIVSDEDERSYGGRVPKGYRDIHSRVQSLEPYDYPETFFQKISHQHKFSIVAIHSIIVKPGDSSCEQSSGGIQGHIYADASEPSHAIRTRYGNIVRGHIGSICSSDYSSQLGPIAHELDKLPPVPLPCFPIPHSVSVKIDNKRVRIRVEGRKIIIEDKVPFGVKAKIDFRCQPKPSSPGEA